MKKKVVISLFIVAFLVLLFGAIHSFALYRNSTQANGNIATAEWSISRNQSASGDSLELVPGLADDNYTLTVQSTSEVDIKYKVIISNLPSDVSVSIDGGSFLSPANGTITIPNVGRINYNDSVKTKTHTLTFRADVNAQFVNSQSLGIDVEFSQVI